MTSADEQPGEPAGEPDSAPVSPDSPDAPVSPDERNALTALIAELEDEQQRLQLSRFDNDDAWALGCAFVEIARDRGLPIVIDIRRFGQQLFHAALPGTTAENDSWVERKVRVVNRFAASSYLIGRRFAADGVELDHRYGVNAMDYATHGGAFPITIAGVGVVGSITVSGLAQHDDHRLVVEVLQQFAVAREILADHG